MSFLARVSRVAACSVRRFSSETVPSAGVAGMTGSIRVGQTNAAPTGMSITPEEARNAQSVKPEEEKFDPQLSPVGLTGGAPEEFVRRTCRIYRPSRSASQQGPEYRWKIEFDTPNKWVNPLMGWTSARDTAQQLREMLYFSTEKQAIEFAEREGFHWTILPYHGKKLKAKAFADNFKWKGPPKTSQQ